MKKCAACGKEGAGMKNCSACHSECYCNSACQRARWHVHKALCKQIQTRIQELEKKGGGNSDRSHTKSMLSKLFRDMWGEVVSYLTLEEVAILDTALNNKGLRPDFLLSLIGLVWRQPFKSVVGRNYDIQKAGKAGRARFIVERGLRLSRIDRNFDARFALDASLFTRLIDLAADEMVSLELNHSAWVTDAVLKRVSQRCPNLLDIDLTYCKSVGDAGFRQLLKGCLKLQRLNAYSTNITDVSLAILPQSITHLDLYNCEISSLGLRHISERCNQLLAIKLKASPALHLPSFMRIIEVCPLQELWLTYFNVTNVFLEQISTKCPDLEVLGLLGSPTPLHPTGVAHLQRLRKMKKISFEQTKGLDDDILVPLLSAFPLLERLDISFSHDITDDVLSALARFCPRLKVLNLDQCFHITDEGIIELSESCLELEEILVDHCDDLTDDSIISLGQHCPNLRSVSAQDCTQVSREACAPFLPSGCRFLL